MDTRGGRESQVCNTTILILLLDPFESAAHGRIVHAQVCRDLIKPIALLIRLAYRFLSPSLKICSSEGFAALSWARGISLMSFLPEACFSMNASLPK